MKSYSLDGPKAVQMNAKAAHMSANARAHQRQARVKAPTMRAKAAHMSTKTVHIDCGLHFKWCVSAHHVAPARHSGESMPMTGVV